MRSLLLVVLFVQLSSGLKILVYNPNFGHSHSKFMGRMGDILAEAGHNVTELIPVMDVKEGTKTSHRTAVIRTPQDPRAGKLHLEMQQDGGLFKQLWTIDPSPMKLAQLTENINTLFGWTCEKTLNQTDVLEKLREEKFDIAIGEAFDFCGLGIFELIGVKTTIACSSSILLDHLAQMTGVPVIPSYVPGAMSTHGEQMTLSERAMNAFGSTIGSSIFYGMEDTINKVFRKHVGPDFRELKETVSASPILLINSIPYLDFPHPTIQKVVDIGGIGLSDPKPLNEEWNNILARFQKNVLISFGSIAKSSEMPKYLQESIIETVKLFPDVQFIWKYETDELTDVPSNLFLSKWTPQGDLLGDPRLSLFITHGGLGSVTEVAYSGTPAIVIPLFADQTRNGLMLVRQEVAEMISKYDMAYPDKLAAVIKKMLYEKSYMENSAKLSQIVKNAPFSPKEVLVKNVEFVGRFGHLPHMDPHGRHLTFAQYFLLDVIAVVTVAALLATVVFYFSVNWLITYTYRWLFGKSKVE